MMSTTKKISRGLVWIIMGMVLIGLVGFGSFNFGSRVAAIGKVGETDIPADRYFREVNAELRAIRNQTGQNITFPQAQAAGLDQRALNTVVSQVALEDETARLGISVGDDELAKRIRDIKAFAGADGKFNRDTYQFVLEQSGLTKKDFEQSLRAEVARTILQGAVANGIAVPDIYADTLFAWVRETRDFTWARVGTAALPAPVGEPDAAALKAYYEAHPADFTLPETRKLTYVWLAPQDVLDQVKVSDDDLRAMYDQRIDQFKKPERRLVERLAFGTEDDAKAAAARLADASATFDDLVAERGLKLTDVDLGDVTRSDLGPAGDAVFATDKPGVVGPVMSDVGPALFRMNAILPAQETSFEDAKAGLKAEFAADAERRLLADLMPELDDALAGGATLEDLAREHGMKLGHMDWTGSETDGIAAYDKFRAAAAKVQKSDYPEIADLSDGGLFALRLDEIVPARLQSLDEVHDAAVAGWKAHETQTEIMAAATKMAGELAAGTTPGSLGLTEVRETGLTRDATVDGTPQAMLEKAFALAKTGDWGVVADSTGAILVRLDAVHPADQTSAEAKSVKQAFAERTAQATALDLQAAFSDALESQVGIQLNRAMINSVNASFH